MAVTAKVLVPSQTLPNAQTTLYTATGVYALLDKFTVINYSAASAVITVHLIPTNGVVGNDNVIVKEKAVQPSEVYTFPEVVGHILNPGGFISVLTTTASALSVRVSGREIT